jgi:hypothetical protein
MFSLMCIGTEKKCRKGSRLDRETAASQHMVFGEHLRVSANTSAGEQAYFAQKDPHPDPLPSDGRGNSELRLSHLLECLDRPTDSGRFSLSHPMGEGRGEGEYFSKSEVVFARVHSPSAVAT